MILEIAGGIIIAFVVIAFWRFVWRIVMLGIVIVALTFGGFLVYDQVKAEAVAAEPFEDPFADLDPPTAGADMRERIEREIVRSCMERNSESSDIGRCLEFRGVNPYLQYVYAD